MVPVQQVMSFRPFLFAIYVGEEFTEYTDLYECTAYLHFYIRTIGPFNGKLGFSQGTTLSRLGKVLKAHPPSKLFVKFRDPNIYDVATRIPSMRPHGHTVPRLDEIAVQQIRAWTSKITGSKENAP
ncbi:hypothetical protein MLD38_007641 [Melastoma candidum]|uniref:Uncharacterized protein n=1 Tax=Melastoma candidum TaxID=119954 RepID=A0ACB9RRQ6_9MYRT|nr:hypothetical protein MLD38_007641 [Melastoma candidum]